METTNTDATYGGANKCKMLVGVIIILFGLLFLAKALGYFSADTVSMVWPILVIIAGYGKFCSCKSCTGTCRTCAK